MDGNPRKISHRKRNLNISASVISLLFHPKWMWNPAVRILPGERDCFSMPYILYEGSHPKVRAASDVSSESSNTADDTDDNYQLGFIVFK